MGPIGATECPERHWTTPGTEGGRPARGTFARSCQPPVRGRAVARGAPPARRTRRVRPARPGARPRGRGRGAARSDPKAAGFSGLMPRPNTGAALPGFPVGPAMPGPESRPALPWISPPADGGRRRAARGRPVFRPAAAPAGGRPAVRGRPCRGPGRDRAEAASGCAAAASGAARAGGPRRHRSRSRGESCVSDGRRSAPPRPGGRTGAGPPRAGRAFSGRRAR